MEPELLALVSTGATTLVELMLTDAWSQAKQAARRVFAGSTEDDKTEAIRSDLESSRRDLQNADATTYPALKEDLRVEWSNRIRRAIISDPEAVKALQELVALSSELPPAPQATVMNSNAYDKSRVYQQGSGTQNNF